MPRQLNGLPVPAPRRRPQGPGPRAWLGGIGAALFGLLGLIGKLDWTFALAGALVMAIVAWLAPRGAERPVPDESPERANHGLRAQAWHEFADALPDPCLILDSRLLIVHRNEAAAVQFPNARTGEPLAFSLRNPALLNAVEEVRRTGAVRTIELHRTVPTEAWHRVAICPLAAEGQPDGRALVVTLLDLTEAKRVDAMRADFIANASHELRTPLTSLVGFIDTLLGPAAKDAAARERFLGIMRNQAQRMSNLVDDMLSLSRIEMRQHVRPTGSLDLSRLIREVAEGLQVRAAEASVTLDLRLPDGPADVTGAREELYEVFENLVDNAIKYGGDGGRVEVELVPADGRPDYAYLVSVTDHGAGIPPEHVPRLTERFYRVDAESSRKKKGTGLGLAIVKHIVTRHRGLMTIRSRPGEGTRVEVLLPR